MIGGFSPVALGQLAAAVGGGSMVSISINLGPLIDAVDDLIQRADEIVDLVSNPDATAADEKCRKGAVALQHGWTDDAISELNASVEIYRFRAMPHLLLGVAKLREGDPTAAVRHWRDAVKYGAAREPRAGLTAALLASALLDSVNCGNAATEVLLEATSLGPNPKVLASLCERGRAADVAEIVTEVMIAEPAAFEGLSVPLEELGPRYADRRGQVLLAYRKLASELEEALLSAEKLAQLGSSAPTLADNLEKLTLACGVPSPGNDWLASVYSIVRPVTTKRLSLHHCAMDMVAVAQEVQRPPAESTGPDLPALVLAGSTAARALAELDKRLHGVATSRAEAERELPRAAHELERWLTMTSDVNSGLRRSWGRKVKREAGGFRAVASDVVNQEIQLLSQLCERIDLASDRVRNKSYRKFGAQAEWNHVASSAVEFLEPLEDVPLVRLQTDGTVAFQR
jgi:hypothetical protein